VAVDFSENNLSWIKIEGWEDKKITSGMGCFVN
jgi:hypothetical protein